jgi:hypothetical protein
MSRPQDRRGVWFEKKAISYKLHIYPLNTFVFEEPGSITAKIWALVAFRYYHRSVFIFSLHYTV